MEPHHPPSLSNSTLKTWSILLIILFACVFSFLVLNAIYHWTRRWTLLKGAMKKFMNKAKSAFEEHNLSFDSSGRKEDLIPQKPMIDGEYRILPATEKDVLRYRYHHGTNVGSIFVQERWLTGSMFAEGISGSSELAAAEGWVKQLGIDGARDRHEKHWKEYVRDEHLDWLRDVAKCTTVRLPIGYFTLGPPYCEGTPFEKVSGVYANAWQNVKEFVQRCHSRGIGTLVDLHALPGGANGGDHSGTNSGKAEFWHSRKHKELAIRCLCFIAQQAKGMEGVAGIQIVNESEWDAKGMYEWYDDVLKEVAKIDSYVPIYISDGWDLNRCLDWTKGRNAVSGGHKNPVVVDTHLYWCFTDADQQKSPQQITQEARNKLSELDGKDGSVFDHGAAQAIIGEYSCVLGESSWQKGGGTPKEQLVNEFGNAQSQRYQQRSGGSFFWTYAMDWMPGGEWGFKQMTEQHAIVPPPSLTLQPDDIQNRLNAAQGQRDGRRGNTWGAHCQYWDTNHPGHYEHQRFEDGWKVGWDDAAAFVGLRSQHGLPGGDKIGMLDLWALKRLKESGQGGQFVWEWEQGFRQGIRDLYEAVGI